MSCIHARRSPTIRKAAKAPGKWSTAQRTATRRGINNMVRFRHSSVPFFLFPPHFLLDIHSRYVRTARSFISAHSRGSCAVSEAKLWKWCVPMGSRSMWAALKLSPEVIIQMFQWNWDSIANECTTFIGPAGRQPVRTFRPEAYPPHRVRLRPSESRQRTYSGRPMVDRLPDHQL
jgi:hypothetical protein